MNVLHIRIKTAVLAGILLLIPMLVACGGAPATVQSSTTSTAAESIPSATAESGASTTAVSTPAPDASEPTTAPAVAPASALPATPADSAEASGNVLRVHQLAYPDTVDPQKGSFTNEIVVMATNYEGLTRLDQDLQSVPAAAEKWEFNERGDELTFTLRDGLTYSDGSPLTADNFRYAIERTCDPNTAGQYQAILFEIVGCADFAAAPITDTATFEAARDALGVEAPDERTLQVKLTHPAPYFPYIAGLWVMFPIRAELVEAGGESWWQHAENHLGNGPFQITEINEDQLIVLKANERYWGGRPKLDGVEFVYQTDPAVALAAYRAGQLDIAWPDPSDIPGIKSDPELSKQLVNYPSAATTQLQFNLAKAPFDDSKVREAFAYAFDRTTFCEQILNGTCVPTLSWIPEGVPGYIASQQFAFDPAKAKATLAESSYNGSAGLPEIKYTYNASNPSEQPRAEWIAGQYRDILGIEIILDPVDIKTLIANTKSNETYPQLSIGGWVQDYPDPQNWLSVYWTSTSIFAQNMGYSNTELDALLAQADVELDPAKRIPLYEQAGQILVDEQPGVFLFNNAVNVLVKPEVTGYQITPSDTEWPGQWTSLLTVDVQR